jgi:hypothetical protein
MAADSRRFEAPRQGRPPGSGSNPEGTVSVTLRITPSSHKALKDEAYRTHRSISSLVIELLEDGWRLYAARADLRARSLGRGVAQARADVAELAGAAAANGAITGSPPNATTGAEPAASGAREYGAT